MAEGNPSDKNQDTPAELAPNMWFTEYGMPFTTMILEAEAAERNNPEAPPQEERSDLAQFIIDQETAVARDYHAGLITKEEFEGYKADAQDRFDNMVDKLSTEIEEFGDDFEDWGKDFEVSVKDFADEHGGEIESIVDLAKTRELEAKDVSLHLMADAMGLGVDGVDDLLERMPPHLHDIVDALGEETVGVAHHLLDAREELSSADQHDLSRDEARLEEIEPVFEAQIDEAHEGIDQDFERIDNDLGIVQDYVEAAQDHGENYPELTVEHMPYRTTEDYDLPEQIEDETGITDA
ncbi:MAG: hypothetical protein AAF184_01860 [Pseudomonadota bacterium]